MQTWYEVLVKKSTVKGKNKEVIVEQNKPFKEKLIYKAVNIAVYLLAKEPDSVYTLVFNEHQTVISIHY